MGSNIEAKILEMLPYRKPFRFIDAIDQINKDSFSGHYTYRQDEFFYEGHFPGHPVTPGVILTETMAQIGLVSFGIYLLMEEEYEFNEGMTPVFTSSNVDFLKPVYPGDFVRVTSTKEYFRLGKLKCQVQMSDKNGSIVSKGYLSGIFLNPLS